jgi:hypothetical protein
MKRYVALFAGLVLSASLVAQTSAPVVPEALALRFFKAQSQSQSARTALEQTPQWKDAQAKQAVLDSVINEFVALCGNQFHPQLNDKGDPVCVENPKPAKVPEKK